MDRIVELKVSYLDSKGRLNPSKRNTGERRDFILSLFPEHESLKEIIFCVLNDVVARPICSVCCGRVNFNTGGYRKTCSLKCGARDPDRKSKTHKTILERYDGVHYATRPEHKELLINRYGKIPGAYGTAEHKASVQKKFGVDNVFQSEEIKTKIKETMVERHGAKNPQQVPVIKAKTEKTNLERYGHKTPFESPQVREKTTATHLERYGVENPQQNLEIRKRTEKTTQNRYNGIGWGSKVLLEKSLKTNLEKHGGTGLGSKILDSRIKATMLSKYGATHPEHVPAIKKRRIESFRRQFIENNLRFKLELIRINQDLYPLWRPESYSGSQGNYEWRHICGYIFISGFINGNIPMCPRCFTASKPHQLLIDKLKERNPDLKMIVNCRSIITPLELDIYLPDYKVAVEINGCWWHQDVNDGKNKLLTKTEKCATLGIRLLHLWDFEVENKLSLVCSMIESKLGLTKRRIFARKCEVKELSWGEAKVFLVNNHLDGAGQTGKAIGLFFGTELVSVITFGRERYKHTNNLELYRACSAIDTTVIGGLSKLLAQIERSIVTFADRRISTGEGYLSIGFKVLYLTTPGYFYYHLKTKSRVSRIQAQKHKLSAWLPIFDGSLTETENMILNGYVKLRDCGHVKLGKQM